MKWILMAMMVSSTGTGPSIPVFMTAEFGDRVACDTAAKQLNGLTRTYRVAGTNIDYGCSPYSSADRVGTLTPDSAPR